MSSKDSLLSRIRPQFTEGLDMPGNTAKPTSSAPTDFRCAQPRYTLNKDVILSASVRSQLDEALLKIEHYQKIYVEWGFGEVDPAGKSLILNFYGPPGTGKTLTAEAFSGSLGKNIMLVSIADLESKFMGDTSKNIVQVFQTAKTEDAVLFFDEADTLLGKRLSSITQGIDNEVNAMRSTLLIELERHEGIVIFATNFAKNYDSAFVSRISQHIKFELPGEEERRFIWSKMLVPGIPLADDRESILDRATQLSESLSGREIRTCMRLALPKALILSAAPLLSVNHIEEAINQVQAAVAELGSKATNQSSNSKLDVARKLLGVS
ncbi:ATP-binding protein [Pseudomonas veronii]|uniref:ATP-binding protein n=1 Tax=Pseudomonas veronii TaxID=76761 RepID=A0A7Y1AAM9_PSEVE|nr:ATP-binding protein [Pseudomonas veronii]NMY12224.1 ATP-binding protein [Pseudomonas veronii]